MTDNCVPVSNAEKLYQKAKASLDVDASPKDIAPDDVACMESVDTIFFRTFGYFINNTPDKITLSTKIGYEAMKFSPLFTQVFRYKRGLIIISPTGYGNGNMAHGHVGITGDYGILSNDSSSGLFKEKWTYQAWLDYYAKLGGFPVFLFEPK